MASARRGAAAGLVLFGLILGYNAAPAAEAGPAHAATCLAPLTLQLRAATGNTMPPNKAPALAPIPPGTVTVHVPLYPGAAATTAREISADLSYPWTPYVKTASATYVLPAGVDTAQTWYVQQFAACGYTQAGSGSGNNGQGVTSTELTFASGHDANLSVQLSFQVVAGHPLVLYVAEYIATPPRPAGSYLPGDVSRVQITYVLPLPQPPSTGPQPRLYRTVSDAAALRPLVRAINALTRLDVGVRPCPISFGESAALVFQRPAGKPITVIVDADGCRHVTVGPYPPLSDPSQAVWKAVSALVYAGGTPTPTAVYGMAAPPVTPTPAPH
jgi:hypothetical protein